MKRTPIAVGLVVLVASLAAMSFERFLNRGAPELVAAAPQESSGTLVAPATPKARLVKPASDEIHAPAEAPAAGPARPAESVMDKLARLKEGSGPVILETQFYRDVPKPELEKVVQRIEGMIYDATKEEMEYRLAARIGVETLSTDPNFRYSGEGYDPKAVYWVRFTPGGPTEKVTLPKDEFPEVYELKALSAALREEINSRRSGG